MVNSTTANVFITTSREVIEEFLNLKGKKIKPKKYFELLSENDKRRSIIAGPEFNSNLIELEHTWNMGGGGHVVTLKMIENGQNFESQFVSKDVYPEIFNSIVKQKQKLNQNFLNLEKPFEDELLDTASKEIYFCYGVGDRVSNWAGPFVMTFTKGEIKISDEGTKEITLQFRGERGKLLRNEIEGGSADVTYQLINKYENIFSNQKIVYNKTVSVSGLNNSNKFGFLRTEVINRKIKNLITSYLTGIVNDASSNEINSNIIVLLPKISLVTKYLVDEYIKSNTYVTAAELREQAIKSNDIRAIEFDKRLTRVEKSYANNNYTLDEIQNAEIWLGSFRTTTREKEFGVKLVKPDINNWDNSLYVRANLKEIYDKLELHPIVNQLGFECKSVYDKVVQQTNAGGGPKIPNPDVQQDAVSQAKNNLFTFFINLSLGDVKDTSTEITPDFYVPLQKFNEAMKSHYQNILNISYKPVLFIENDMNILKLWKKYKFISDDTKPAFIFGDDALIGDLLYLSDTYSEVDTQENTYPTEKISEDDYKLFFDKQYRSDYYSEFKYQKRNSSFGENVFTNDELALNEQAFNALTLLDIPIFRFNISNPNVMSVSLQNNLAYKSVLDMGYRNSAISRVLDANKVNITESIDKKILNFEPYTLDRNNVSSIIGTTTTTPYVPPTRNIPEEQVLKDLEELIRLQIALDTNWQGKKAQDKFNEINSAITEYYKVSKTSKEIQDRNEQTALALALFNKFDNSSFVPYVETLNSRQKLNFELQLYNRLSELVLQINIKTLPFFSISGNRHLGKCYFIGMENMIGNKKKKPSIFNGLYYILGYRHVISTKEIYSEFQLSKTPNVPK